MTTDTLHKAIRAQPFEPFILHLADGRKVPVDHPELIAHAQGARTAVVMKGDSFDSFDLLLVVSLEKQPARPEAKRRRGSA